MKKKQLLLNCTFFLFNIVFLFAQNSISGTITTETGTPLEGVSVTIKNQQGTETDSKGFYKIQSLQNGTYSLETSLLGYQTNSREVSINNASIKLDITLVESISNLEQVTINSHAKDTEVNKIPSSVNILSNQFIQNNGIEDLDEISAFVPGLQVLTQNPNTPSIAIRGISTEDSQSSAIPRVSTLQDGIYLGKSRGSVVSFFDSETIDVYKGPQTTAFGRTIQSGAINIIQKKAKNLTEGYLTVGAGTFDSRYATGAFNTPILKDKLFLRVSGIYDANDGYVIGFNDEDYNGKETLGLRGALRYQIKEKSTLDIIANYQRDTPPGLGYKSAIIGQLDGNTDRFGPVSLNNSENLGVDRTIYSVIGLLDHEISSNLKTTAKVGYRNFDSDDLFDLDGSPAPAAEIRELALGEQASAEIKASYDNELIKINIGAHYLYEDTSQDIDINVNEQNLFVTLLAPEFSTVAGQVVSLPAIPAQLLGNDLAALDPRLTPLIGLPLQPFNTEVVSRTSTNNTVDVFGDFAITLFKKLELGIGARASWEQAEAGITVTPSLTPSPIGALTGVGLSNITFTATNGTNSRNEEFYSITGNAFAKYNFTETANIYVNIAKGRRPDIIDLNESTPIILTDEELLSYEVGGKILAFNNKLQVNGSVFYYDYSNFRTPTSDNGNTGMISFSQQDSGAATVKGAEISVNYNFGKKSSIFANYSHLETSFDDTDENGRPLQFAGNRFRQAPNNSYALGGNFQTTIDDTFDFYFRPNFSFKSKVFYTFGNNEELTQSSFGLFNFSTGIILKKGIEVSLYMKNVFDKNYIIDAGNQGNAFGIPTIIQGSPRFYGARLGYSF